MEKPMQWVEKYRPQTLEDLLIDDDTKLMLQNYLKDDTIPNLMLAGTPGKGKTSLAEVLVLELGCDELYINASEERGIDTVRSKIIDFADSTSIAANIKIVILDESDAMTIDAQMSLKNIIEKSSSDTRFIFTCNNVNKMEKAIRSRCTEISVSAPVKVIFKRLLDILDKEEIKYTEDNKREIVESVIKRHFPDIRAMVQHLEVSSVSKEFSLVKYNSDDDINSIVDYVFNNLNGSTQSVRKCREYWIQHSAKFGNEYDTLATYVFNKALNVINSPKHLDEINKYIVEFNHGAFDQEIIFAALINRVGLALKENK
jgi:replication factor C small subunit